MESWHITLDNLTQIGGFLIASLSAMLLMEFKDWFRKHKKRSIHDTVQDDTQVYQLLYELRGIIDCDRVKLFQFINGNYYFGGTSDQRMTLTHLVTRVGVGYPEGLVGSRQTIPISHVTHLLQGCLEQNKTVVLSLEQVQDPCLKQLLINSGTHWIAAACLFNSKNQCVGVLMATWLPTVNPELSPQAHKGFIERVNQLSAAISSRAR